MRLLRLLVRLTAGLLVTVAVLLATVWGLAFDAAPAVERKAQLTPEHIERAQQILKGNDPRRLRSGTMRSVRLEAADVDVAINYLAGRYAGGSARAVFGDDALRLDGSVRAPRLPWRPYLNVSADLAGGAGPVRLRRVSVGRLPLPSAGAQWLAVRLLSAVLGADDVERIAGAITEASFDEQGATVVYRWNSGIMDTVRAALVSSDNRMRLRAYQEALADAADRIPERSISLVQLLQPLFALALKRSAAGDPVAENRAALLVVTMYTNGRSLREVIPEARDWRRPARHGVRLRARGDLAQHFTVSAVLSANTGGPFAEAVGIYKEVADSRGGSGFSFDDIAADRAGSRLGTMAETAAMARLLQERLAGAADEAYVMPSIDGLPGGLSDADFHLRFGGVDGPGYTRMLTTIDARVAALPLFAGLGPPRP